MPNRFRPLLPAPDGRPESELTFFDVETSDTIKTPLKRKRVAVVVACDLCRSKRTRCNEARPVCGACKRRRVEKCVYTEIQKASKHDLEILDLLKSSTGRTAIDTLRLLRTYNDPAIVLSLVTRETDDNQHSSACDPGIDRKVSSKRMLETELMIKNPVSYPVLRPISESSLKQSNLIQSVDFSHTEFHVHRPLSQFEEVLAMNRSRTVGIADVDFDSVLQCFRGPALKLNPPDNVREICDRRLSDLNISVWTNVQIPKELAAKVISLYLRTDHPLLGTFEPDLFVAGLVTHHQTSCSSFLVNALLYWGCQMYSAIDKSADAYTQQFCVEAERLWSVEKTSDSVLTMIGAQMLSIAYIGNGKSHEALIYLTEAIRMGIRLGLLGVEEKTALSKLANVPKEMLYQYSFAAWGVFNWAILFATFYRQAGLLYPRFPPSLPIPGYFGREGPTSSGSMTAGFEYTQRVLPPYMGNTFPFICEFWRIMREVPSYYSSRQEDLRECLSIHFAELKYRELLAWAETLPVPVIRNNRNPHHVMIFHMWIHCAILDILRPFVTCSRSEPLRLRTFSTPHCTPTAAYDASLQLKQLIFDFRSYYKSSVCTILWQTALMYVATAVLQDTKDPTWRLWFRLCIYGYEALRRPFRISEVIGRGLLTMAMRDTDMTSEEARKLMNNISARGLGDYSGIIRATFMSDSYMAQSNPEGAKMETLANEFEDMALFREYINNHSEAGKI